LRRDAYFTCWRGRGCWGYSLQGGMNFWPAYRIPASAATSLRFSPPGECSAPRFPKRRPDASLPSARQFIQFQRLTNQ
jgi:hypothetical protein